MRLFAAVDLDETVRTTSAGSARALTTRLDPSSTVRWVAPEQLHVTLRFLGEVSDVRAESVRRALSVPWDICAFTASLAGVDLFPSSGAPSVIWLGVDEGREQMVALRAELDRRLVPLGFKPETRPFRAHLTLGRVRRRGAILRPALLAVLSKHEPAPAHWVVDRVSLYESRWSYRGSTYHVVESAVLPPSLETE